MNDPVYSIHRSAPAGGNPTAEQAALLRERYDGQVKTFRELGEETDVHWTIWRRWALELGLKNPKEQQPKQGYRSPEERYTRPKPAAIAAVPDELEPEEEELDELEETRLGDDESTEAAEADVAQEAPPPAPAPVVAMSPARMRPHRRDLSWDDRQFLTGYLDRLPTTWTTEERERWLRAFVATVDLLVAIEQQAGEGTP